MMITENAMPINNRITSVGFTGTRKGMTPKQRTAVRSLLLTAQTNGAETFRHGRCRGSDVEAAYEARVLGYRIVAYPADTEWDMPDDPADEVRESKGTLKRNREIVEDSHTVIATPRGVKEQYRGSGTWATIRVCRMKRRPHSIVFPDGSSVHVAFKE